MKRQVLLFGFSVLFIKNEKILFTGGSGYIGSHIINELNKHTYKIYNYDLIVYDHYINQGVEKIRGDICDQDKLTKILLEIKPDLIIHLAALTNVEESTYILLNTMLRILLEQCHYYVL